MSRVVWSTPAMGMVPTAQTAQEHKYVTTGGRIKFDVGQAGTISFVAAIQVPLREGRYVMRAHVERLKQELLGTSISLRRARRSNGQVETIFSSNIFDFVTVNEDNVWYVDSPGRDLDFDLENFYYWVQVTDTNDSPATAETVDAVLGVSLILE